MPKTEPQPCKRWAIFRPDGILVTAELRNRRHARKWARLYNRGRRHTDRYTVRRVTITPEE